MKVFYAVLSALLVAVNAQQELVDYDDMDNEARLFFVNFTSSLVQVNATILAYGLLFLAILGAAAVALYYLYLESQNSSYGQSYGYGNNQYNYQYARYVRNPNRPGHSGPVVENREPLGQVFLIRREGGGKRRSALGRKFFQAIVCQGTRVCIHTGVSV